MDNKKMWRSASVAIVVAALLFLLAGSAYMNLYGAYGTTGTAWASGTSGTTTQTCPRTGCSASSCHGHADPGSFYGSGSDSARQ